MSLSRRQFFRGFGALEAGVLSGSAISARGLEAAVGEMGPGPVPIPLPPEPDEIRISSNENPLGPGDVAIRALKEQFDQGGRYPFNARVAVSHLTEKLAECFEVQPKNVTLGAGSGEILRNAVRSFTSKDRPLVTADPSFENPVRTAKLLDVPIEAVPVGGDLGLDMDSMLSAARGAGLIFLCNPNNPTATVHSWDEVAYFVAHVYETSPGTAILVDEAYHDYVTDEVYRSAVPFAMKYPNVFVTRTFSKAYGMAGLRVGYAIGQGETIKRLAKYKLALNVNVLAVGAAVASLGDPQHIEEERERNTEARKFTLDFFAEAGFKSTDSQTNFIFVELGRPAKDFREGCLKYKVRVGRDFPPFEKTHARISIGTMDEMRRATEVFKNVLMGSTNDASVARALPGSN
jgi:histidinol-phosphate aminotransferase